MKMKYPKNRRSPVSHDVGGYTRKNGARVSGYKRGHGTRTKKTKKSRTVGKVSEDVEDIKIHGYVVNLKYSDKPGDGETILAISDQKRETVMQDYKEILDEAFEERVDTRVPISIEIVDPSFSEVIKIMSEKVKGTIKWGAPKVKQIAKQTARIGADYAIRATMIAGSTAKKVARAGYDASKEVARLSAFAVQKELIHNLLKLCYQKDPAKRLAARAALKTRYPEIYDMTDFSRETRTRPRRRKPKPRAKRTSRLVGQQGQVIVLPLRYRTAKP